MHFSKPPLGTPLDWENPLNRGAVMALAMNEGNGDKVQDISLNRNHGTLNNFSFPSTVASGWNPGQTGIGLKFDGIGNHLNCGTNPILNPSKFITISAVINSNSLTNTQVIIGNNFSSSHGYELHINTNGAVVYKTSQAAANQYTVSSNGDISTNQQYHVIATRDGTNAEIYIDGVLRTSAHGNHIDPVSNATPMYVGTYRDIGSYFNGSIDQPRIMTRAWSAKEVRDYAINPWQVYLDE